MVFVMMGCNPRQSRQATIEAVEATIEKDYDNIDAFFDLRNAIVRRCQGLTFSAYRESIDLVVLLERFLSNPTMRSMNRDFRDSVIAVKSKLRVDAELHPNKRIDVRPHCREFNAILARERRKPDNPSW